MKNLLICFLLLPAMNSHADTKRIEVYTSSQAYWDIKSGDTLGEIVTKLFPDQATRRISLITEIVKLNPSVFSNNNPDIMKANVRLWLPGYSKNLSDQLNNDKYTSKKFSWGYIHFRK